MSRKKKIIHICDKFGVKGSSIHGVSRLFSWWFPRFNTKYYDVQLVGLRRPDKAVENLQQQGINIVSLNKSKFDISTLNEIVRIVHRERPDILHLHGYGAANFGRVAARMTKVKTIVHEHFVDPAMPKYQGYIDYLLSQYTDYAIAVSHSVKDFMVEKRFFPQEKVAVVFNGAPLDQFKPVSKEEVHAEREKWGIPEDCKIIASIGRLDGQKGNSYLLDAAAQVLRKGHRMKCMLVGDGPLLDELKEQCVKEGIEKDVIFTGYYVDIPLIQSMIDIQVFPSLFEGTPLTLFEAMSMRLAIISTNVDGLGEILRHEKNALLVAPKNPEQLAAAIEDLLVNPAKADYLAHRAQQDSKNFDIQRTIDCLQNIYDRLLN